MYTDHFKLSDKPFNNCPGDGIFTPNDNYESAVARIEEVLLSRNAVAVITGGPGVGKTTIVSTAANRVGDKAIVAYIDMRLTNPDLLFDLLLLKLGGESGDGDQATSLYRLKSAIARHNDEQGRKVTAVIDVSSLTIERAKRIMQLVHMSGDPDGQLNVVLLGPHVLHKLLDTPGLIHMRQRVTFRYRTRPLTVAETESYINQQLAQSAGQPDSIMVHGTSIIVYQYVGGVPRLINTLMDATLCHAADNQVESITPNMVTEVAKLLGWRRLSDNKSSQPKKIAAAAAGTRQMDAAAAIRTTKEPDLLEVSATGSPETAIGDSTAMLMAVALDDKSAPADDSKQDLKLAEPETKSNGKLSTSEKDRKPEECAVPEMNADDTSATGMLRLEDLDARFAETIFGDDFKEATS